MPNVYIVKITHDFPEDGFEIKGAFSTREKAINWILNKRPTAEKQKDGCYIFGYKKWFKYNYDYFDILEFEVT